MKSPFYNPSTALNAVAVAVGPADPPAFKRRSNARPEELDVMGLCSARNFNAATSCAPCDANHGCQGKTCDHRLTLVASKENMKQTNTRTNERTNERTNKQIKKHMFIKHGFSKTNMFLPWHVPIHYATKMGKHQKKWTYRKTLHIWIGQTPESEATTDWRSDRPCRPRYQHFPRPLGKKQENIKRWSEKNRTCTSLVSFRFHTESANFQELVKTWKFLAWVETSGACQAAHSRQPYSIAILPTRGNTCIHNF